MTIFSIALGAHAVFIIAAYVVALGTIALMIAWVLLDYRRQQNTLDELEAGGVRRRSEVQAGRPHELGAA